MTSHRIGLVVNPVAGIGGRLGWHGSDVPRPGAPEAVDRPAAARVARALSVLAGASEDVELTVLTAAGPMGADAVTAVGPGVCRVVYDPPGPETTAEDTRRAVAAILAVGVELIVFVGGDGTARDVCSAVGLAVPVIGVPAGVKMHSGVFGRTPEAAAGIVLAYLQGRAAVARNDVVDLDEEARERGDLTTRLYGQLLVPNSPDVQRGKITVRSDGDAAMGIAAELRDRLKDGYAYVFGPGTTIQAVGAELGWELSLLGVDLVIDGRVERDLSAPQLSEALGGTSFQVIVSPIGGQGMVLGRGNQPIDREVLDRLDPADLLIVCAPQKLNTLRGELYLDAPEPALNQRFAGPHRVMTGYRQEAVVMLR